jgi:hypothetical protein
VEGGNKVSQITRCLACISDAPDGGILARQPAVN